MIDEYINIALKICSLVLMVIAAGLWAITGIDTRPKYRDEQTLVGGTIWSQLMIPMGLLLSKIVNESVDKFVHGYFLMTGVVLCITTGTVLIVGEIKSKHKTHIRHRASRDAGIEITTKHKVDRTYFGIGILSLATGSLIFVQFVIIYNT